MSRRCATRPVHERRQRRRPKSSFPPVNSSKDKTTTPQVEAAGMASAETAKATMTIKCTDRRVSGMAVPPYGSVQSNGRKRTTGSYYTTVRSKSPGISNRGRELAGGRCVACGRLRAACGMEWRIVNTEWRGSGRWGVVRTADPTRLKRRVPDQGLFHRVPHLETRRVTRT